MKGKTTIQKHFCKHIISGISLNLKHYFFIKGRYRKNVMLLIAFFLAIASSFAQSNHKYYPIQDTATLRKVIKQHIGRTEATEIIHNDSITALFNTALLLKDTMAGNGLCTDLAFLYYITDEIEDGIQWMNNCSLPLMEGTEVDVGELYMIFGNLYSVLGYDTESLEYYFKSLEWYQRCDEQYSALPLGNIALKYYENKEYKKALKYNRESHDYSLKIEDEEDRLYNIAYDYKLFGEIYEKLDSIELAKRYYEKSLDKINNDSEEIMLIIARLIEFYASHGYLQKIEALIKKGDKYDKESYEEASYLLAKSNYYIKSNQISKAIDPAELSFEGAYLRSHKYEYAANYYVQTNDSQNAKKYFDYLLEETKRIHSEANKKILANIESKYKAKRLEQENIELIKETTRRKNYLTLIVGLLLIILPMLLLQSYNNQKTKKLNNTLEIKTRELEKSNANLASSNDELERFAFIASHDLKTPLHNIIRFTGLLKRKLGANKEPIVEECINFIESGGKKMNTLIEDVLEYSKLSHSEENEKPRIIDLNTLVQEIAQLVSNTPEGKKANIEISALPILNWNYSKIFILFKNIIENGLIYNESDTPTVKIYSTKNTDSHTIYIEDNGIGIEQEYFDKIFIMFKRLHTHQEYTGTGLGLSTSKKIVTELKGKISVESKIGEGTIFKLKIPNAIIQNMGNN